MRYIIAAATNDCYKAIARVASLRTALLLQFALEQSFLLKVVIVDSRGL